MRNTAIAGFALVVAFTSPSAIAQQQTAGAPQTAGTITYLKTDPGSVLVERGSQIYELKEGDAVFPNDRIFTRTNGSVRFKISSVDGCDIGLGGQQSIVVTVPAVCKVVPTTLAASEVIGGVTVGTGGQVAATPTLLLALLAGGGAAAAAAGNNDNTPASP